MNGFRLGMWTVDASGRLLTNGQGSVRVSPRAFKVLMALATDPGTVVTRQQLLSSCWPDGFVGDEVLTHAISELRQALGDSRLAPRYIETVSKAGYRLLPPVQPLPVRIASYDLYLQGRYHLHRGGRVATLRARQLFSHALQVTPDYAPALSGSADAELFLYLYYDPAPELLTRARLHSQQAIEADPELPQAHASRGLALAICGDARPAIEQFDHALELSSNNFEALYLYGRMCFAIGRFDAATTLLSRARTARPDDFHTSTLLAKALRACGDDKAARQAHVVAFDLIRHHLRLQPNDIRAYSEGTCALIELGRTADGLAWGRRALELAGHDPVSYYVACGYARAGRSTLAIATLRAAMSAGWSHFQWLGWDPDWAHLRDDRRFQDLLTAIK